MSAVKRKKMTSQVREANISNTEYRTVRKELIETIVDCVACAECFETKMECSFTNLHTDIFKISCQHCGSVVIDSAPESKVLGLLLSLLLDRQNP